MRPSLALLAAAGGLAALPAAASAKEYYSAPNGTPAATCQVAATPCDLFSAQSQVRTDGAGEGDTWHLAPAPVNAPYPQGITIEDETDGVVIRGDGAGPDDTVIPGLAVGRDGAGRAVVRNLRVNSNVASSVIRNAGHLTLEGVNAAALADDTGRVLLAQSSTANDPVTILRRFNAYSERNGSLIQADGPLTMTDSQLRNVSTAGNAGGVFVNEGDAVIRRSEILVPTSAAGTSAVRTNQNTGGTKVTILIDSSLLQGGQHALRAGVPGTATRDLAVDVRNSTLLGGAASFLASRDAADAGAVAFTAGSSVLSPAPAVGANPGGSNITATCEYSALPGGGGGLCMTGTGNVAYEPLAFFAITPALDPDPKAPLSGASSGMDKGDPAALLTEEALDLLGQPRAAPSADCSAARRDIGAVEVQAGAGVLGSTLTAPSSATVGVPVAFAASTDKPSTTYLWDFGDGGSSTLAAPQHTYASAGQRTVRVTVTAGVCSVQREAVVTVAAAAGGGGGGGGGGGTTLPPGGGGGGGTLPPARDTTKPAVGARLAKSSVARGKKARLTLTLSEAATVKVVASQRTCRRVRGKRRCTTKKVTLLSRSLAPGPTTVNLGLTRLRAGRATLTVTATDRAGNTSAPARRGLTVRRR